MRIPGRYCDLNGLRELTPEELEAGMDFRLPQHRRATFLRFYEFHLRYRGHPGCVYYLMPYLAKRLEMDEEQRLWFAYINGNTQNPVTSYLIFREFPDVHTLNVARLENWFRDHYAQLAFDTDRRYFKKHFVECVENYRRLARGGQAAMFAKVTGGSTDGEANFRALWRFCNDRYVYFGRLSVFSYLEYLRIMGIEVDCDQLFLEDMSGSKSHRNGLCKVLGRDDLDWHDSNPAFDGDYTGLLPWLKLEGQTLRDEARRRFAGTDFEYDVGYFTLESALCTYKSWHRKNRRYPNVYNDMLVERIRHGEKAWGEPLPIFWEARAEALPAPLRLEDNPDDPGVKPPKQNHYRETGEVVMMDYVWPVFRNSLLDRVRR